MSVCLSAGLFIYLSVGLSMGSGPIGDNDLQNHHRWRTAPFQLALIPSKAPWGSHITFRLFLQPLKHRSTLNAHAFMNADIAVASAGICSADSTHNCHLSQNCPKTVTSNSYSCRKLYPRRCCSRHHLNLRHRHLCGRCQHPHQLLSPPSSSPVSPPLELKTTLSGTFMDPSFCQPRSGGIKFSFSAQSTSLPPVVPPSLTLAPRTTILILAALIDSANASSTTFFSALS